MKHGFTVRWRRERTCSHALILRKDCLEMFCLSSHAAHTSSYINLWCFSVHEKMVSVLKGQSSYFIYSAAPLSLSPSLSPYFHTIPSLYKYVQCHWDFIVSWGSKYLVYRPEVTQDLSKGRKACVLMWREFALDIDVHLSHRKQGSVHSYPI